MQKLIALFIFANFICFQVAVAQRGSKASDACPGSNKNTRTSKEYAALSKRSAADNSSDFSKPRYQSVYSKRTVANTEMKRGKALVNEAKAVPANSEKKTTALAEKKPVEAPQTKALVEEDEFVVEKTESSKPFDVIPTENVAPPKQEREEGTTASSKNAEINTPKQKTKKAADLSKAKASKEKKKACVKKTRHERKSPNDCPEF